MTVLELKRLDQYQAEVYKDGVFAGDFIYCGDYWAWIGIDAAGMDAGIFQGERLIDAAKVLKERTNATVVIAGYTL